MRVLHLNYTDAHGGAARVAVRLHDALLSKGITSELWVNRKTSNRPDVRGHGTPIGQLVPLIRPRVTRLALHVMRTKNPILHSLQVLPSGKVADINSSSADVIHLHWTQGEMLSIADIGKIRKPVVWTLHDEWGFCGAEHSSWDSRWKDGYSRSSRPHHEGGLDLNRWTWERKLKHWRRPVMIVAPSNWIGDRARQSKVMETWPVRVIPNAISLNKWAPRPMGQARAKLDLPSNAKLLLFSSAELLRAPHKGFDLLLASLEHLRRRVTDQAVELVVIGRPSALGPELCGFKVHRFDYTNDDETLVNLYNSACATVVPSRSDNLPTIAVESVCCGTPVVSFDIGGLPDVVSHRQNGYLARAFEPEDLANGMAWVITDVNPLATRDVARRYAEDRYDANGIVQQHLQAYHDAITLSRTWQ